MISIDVLKASAHATVGVFWRLAFLAVAALLFNLLGVLGRWETRFAPSADWAGIAPPARQGHEWAPAIADAARRIEAQVGDLRSEDALFKELARTIGGKSKFEDPLVEDYRRDVRSLADEKAARISELTPIETELRAAVAQLRTVREEIAGDPTNRELRAQRTERAAEVNRLIMERTSVETAYQKKIGDLETKIRGDEQAMREAFDAWPVAARPADNLVVSTWPKKALQAGTRGEPLHIVYVVVFYGIEGAIALLVGVVVMPWLLSLAKSGADPAEIQSTLTARIKEWLKQAFTRPSTATAAKAALAAVLGTATMVSTTVGAGNAPPLAPDFTHAHSAGEKAEKGETGAPGERGEKGDPGSTAIPADVAAKLAELQKQIQVQKDVILTLRDQLASTTSSANTNTANVATLTGSVGGLATNVDRLSSGFGSLTSTLNTVNDNVGGLASATHSMLRATASTRRDLLDSINVLEKAATVTAQGVHGVSTNVGQVAAKVDAVDSKVGKVDITSSETRADVIITAVTGDGLLRPLNPFYRYLVTPEVTRMVKGAVREDESADARLLFAALEQMESGPPRRIWSFQDVLEGHAGKSNPLLTQFMPLILRVSRVRG